MAVAPPKRRDRRRRDRRPSAGRRGTVMVFYRVLGPGEAAGPSGTGLFGAGTAPGRRPRDGMRPRRKRHAERRAGEHGGARIVALPVETRYPHVAGRGRRLVEIHGRRTGGVQHRTGRKGRNHGGRRHRAKWLADSDGVAPAPRRSSPRGGSGGPHRPRSGFAAGAGTRRNRFASASASEHRVQWHHHRNDSRERTSCVGRANAAAPKRPQPVPADGHTACRVTARPLHAQLRDAEDLRADSMSSVD